MFGLSNATMAWPLGILLGGLTLTFLAVLCMKPKQYDPQMGQAQGCLMLMLFGLALLDALLALAIVYEWSGVISTLFAIIALPMAWILLGLVYNGIRWGLRRRPGA